jgi:acyl carrier protein
MTTSEQPEGLPASQPGRTSDDIRNWIVTRVAERLQVAPEQIRSDEPLIDIGLDSMEFVALVGELERWLGVRFRDNPLIDYPTLDTLSSYLADQLARGKTVIDPSERDPSSSSAR